MATAVGASTSPRPHILVRIASDPQASFWIAALIILGGCAVRAATGHWENQPNRDLYQHMAALRSLMNDLASPSNPYVATAEGSRHFHPYWVAFAWVGKTAGLSLSQVIAVASFFSMAVLGYGFWLFGRAYFRSDWGPVALLVAVTLAWTLPLSHTGFINVPTLAEGAAYPAQLLNGLCFILWALVIGTIARPTLTILIAPLVGLMFATHQLGAGLGLIVATSIALFWPGATYRSCIITFGAFAVGLLLSMAWPYHDPFDVIQRAGNPNWRNGVDWFSGKRLFALLVPSAIGIFGLLRPVVPGTGRPLLAVLPVFVLGFISAQFGFQTGSRFGPIAVVLLQIGIGALLVRFLNAPHHYPDRFKLALAGTTFGVVCAEFILLIFFYYPNENASEKTFGSVYWASRQLTADIPDDQEIAAYDVAAWPISATGQNVLSVPWPEPMIADLPQRQAKVMQLFSSRISRAERLRLAKASGVRTLILDVRFGRARMWPWSQKDLEKLHHESVSVRWSGPMMRFDLY